jgi:pimeloyl-ACP methyl ester carboxylesterase
MQSRLIRLAGGIVVLAGLAALDSGDPGPQAGADPALVLEATFTTVANGWVQVERYLDTTPGFTQEQFPPDGRGNQDGQRLTFFGGVTQPFSGRFLLYYAPGWNTNARPVPVLLVHGANDNADRAWANPDELGGFGCGAITCPTTGLMQQFSSNGFRVFAVNFAQKQGDNYMQAQVVADAIQIIKTRLGVPQVDLVGWSKGATVVRMYVSSVKPSWGRAYAGDVRRLVMIGGPNKGYDYPFAHGWAHDFSIWPECGGTVNAPAPHIAMTCYDQYTFHPELSIFTTPEYNCFPGQKQMLYRWDDVFGIDETQEDWYTTYYGGQGFFTDGYGIQTAIDQGSVIETMRAAGIPASVPTYLLAGGAPTIPTVYNENRGPSDGVLFIVSATDTGGIATVGDIAVIATDNHLELGWEPAAMAQVESWLR